MRLQDLKEYTDEIQSLIDENSAMQAQMIINTIQHLEHLNQSSDDIVNAVKILCSIFVQCAPEAALELHQVYSQAMDMK